MTQEKNRIWRWTRMVALSLLAAIASIALLLWIAARLFEDRITAFVEGRIVQALPANADLEFGELQVNPFAGSILIDSLSATLTAENDTGSKAMHRIRISKVFISGVSLVKLIANRISVDQITIANGSFSFDKTLLQQGDTLQRKREKQKWKSIQVKEFQIDSLHGLIKQDTAIVVEGMVHMIIDDVQIPLQGKIEMTNIDFIVRHIDIERIHVSPPGEMYTASVLSISTQSPNYLIIDSLVLAPVYPKYEFARIMGKQTDRINLTIPEIEILNLPIEKIKHQEFSASRITVHNARLHTFRDKRVPFRKDSIVPLPYTAFSRIPFHINIDTLEVKTALIEYEEFPEVGDSSGTASFNDLYATLYRCNNRTFEGDTSTSLDVRSAFMGNGLLVASFQIPHDTVNGRYTAGGTFRNFNLTSLNPALRHLAKMTIDSGDLSEMDFNFSYDRNQSTGSLMMTYENLRVIALTEDSEKNLLTQIKTFLVNTFFIKKNKDESVSAEKRTGEIAFDRDPKRSVFNYWWKSLLSGIKSSYGIEDLMPTESESQ